MQRIALPLPDTADPVDLVNLETEGLLDYIIMGSLIASQSGDQAMLVDVLEHYSDNLASEDVMDEQELEQKFGQMFSLIEKMLHICEDFYRHTVKSLRVFDEKHSLALTDVSVSVDRDEVIITLGE